MYKTENSCYKVPFVTGQILELRRVFAEFVFHELEICEKHPQNRGKKLEKSKNYSPNDTRKMVRD